MKSITVFFQASPNAGFSLFKLLPRLEPSFAEASGGQASFGG